VTGDLEDAEKRQSRLCRVLLEWLECIDQGHVIDIDDRGEFALEMEEFQKTYAWIEQIAAPLRGARAGAMTMLRSRIACN
jgi:hypothetical protein